MQTLRVRAVVGKKEDVRQKLAKWGEKCACSLPLDVVLGLDGWVVARVCLEHGVCWPESMPVQTRKEAEELKARLEPGIQQ